MKPKGKMELCLKITAGLLLLVQASHLASLQYSTDSPGRTIDKSWLRELGKNTAGSQNAAFTEEEKDFNQGADATAMEANNEYSGGIASGSMALYSEEEENVAGGDKDAAETSDDLSVVTTTEPPTSTVPNVTTKQPELPDASTVSPTTVTTDPTNSNQINMTEAEEEFLNSTTTPQTSTTHQSAQNPTSFPDHSNHTDLQNTTLAPESNATQESTAKPDEDTGLTNATASNNTTAVTTTTTAEINETPTTSSSTTVFLPETAETAAVPNTPEKANNTDKNVASGSSSERGTAAVSGVTVSGAQFYVQKTAFCVFLVA